MSRLSSPGEPTVLVVDDRTLFAETLCTALEIEGYDTRWATPDQVGAEVATGDVDARRLALLDLDAGSAYDTLVLLEHLTRHGVQVVVVTASEDRLVWAECLEAGAEAVLPKNLPLADVLSVVRRLGAGLPVMGRTERRELVAERRRRASIGREASGRFGRLDQTEHRVFVRLVEGRSLEEIAAEDGLSRSQARGVVRSMLDKLGVVTWLEAVGMANEHDLTPADLDAEARRRFGGVSRSARRTP